MTSAGGAVRTDTQRMKYPSLVKTFHEHWRDTLYARRPRGTEPERVAPTLCEFQDATHWPRTGAVLPVKLASAVRRRAFRTSRRTPSVVLIIIALLGGLSFLATTFICSTREIPKDATAQHGDGRHQVGDDFVFWPFLGVGICVVCGAVGVCFLLVTRGGFRELKAHVQALHLIYIHTKSSGSDAAENVVYCVRVEDTVFKVFANGSLSESN